MKKYAPMKCLVRGRTSDEQCLAQTFNEIRIGSVDAPVIPMIPACDDCLAWLRATHPGAEHRIRSSARNAADALIRSGELQKAWNT